MNDRPPHGPRRLLYMLAATLPGLLALAWLAGGGGLGAPLALTLFATSLVALLLAWLAGRPPVDRRVDPVLDTVRRVAGGDLDARTAMQREYDDQIDRLADEVDRMAEALARRDRALTEALDRAQAYLDIVDTMVLVLNARGHVAIANRKTLEVLGCRPADCTPAVDWFGTWAHEDDRAGARAVFERLLTGDPDGGQNHEYRVRTARQQTRLIAWRNSPVRDAGGKIIGLLASGEDVTGQREAQAEQERLRLQLQQSQKMEALGQLTGGIAHDFNNILASVLGFARLGLRRPALEEAPELTDYLREIVIAGERARDLVAKMLAFGRAQPGHAAIPVAPVPLVQETIKLLAATLPAGIRVDTRLADGLPEVAIDPVALHQILMNLTINARDALDGRGRILIGLERHEIDRLTCTACHDVFSGDYVELSVIDDGQGIPPDALPHIFEPFYTTKEVGKGTGMGLAMVHGLVRRAGGHFGIDSQAGVGTAFRVYLPVAGARAPIQPEARPAVKTATTRRGRVMLVDDEPAILRLLDRALGAEGWQTTLFNDPGKALEAFRATPDAWDVVVTDLTMPTLNGDELIAALRGIRPALEAILCTGYDDRIDEETARAQGIRHFFLKPVDIDLLVNTLAAITAGKNTYK